MSPKLTETRKHTGKRGRRKRRAARLVQGYLERKRRRLLDSRFEELESVLPHQRGVYALYKGDRLYYIGIARRNLAGRIRHHTNDKHAKRWDKFSLYVCKSVKTIAALEKLFLRIAKPPGNGQIGRLRSPDLTDDLRQRIQYGMEKEITTY